MSEQSQMHLHRSRKANREAYVEFQLTQHQFHSERQQTAHSLDTSLRHSSDITTNHIIEFHINNPIRQILYQFRNMLKTKGYKCIEIFQNQLYIVRMTLNDKLKKLFMCREPPKFLLTIRTHQYRSVRTVTIKPMHHIDSNPQKHTPSSIVEAQQILQFLSTSRNLNKPLTNEQLNQLDSEYKQDIYSLDATANYMFSRMLVDTNYSIGKRIALIVNQFRDEKKRSLEDVKFSELLWVNKAIGQVTEEMLEGFNCSRKELYEILGYCRKSIESYFYRCIEQNKAQTLPNKKKQNIPEKDQPNSKNQSEQKRTQSTFSTIYPVSIKHLHILIKSFISIQVYEQLFSFTEFVKIQTLENKVQEEKRQEFLEWVKQEYGQKIIQKLKILRAAGFVEKCFESFVKDLKLQE